MPNFSRPSEQIGKKEHDKSFDENRDEEVIIVGAGASGLAVAACLADLGISSLVLERDFCVGSLWKNRTYDRVTLQGSNQHSSLPLMPVPDEYPVFLTRDHFSAYLEKYARRFKIQPQFCQTVESASFSQETGRWHVIARCSSDNSEREYHGRFLVVATGEFSEKFIPDVPGLDSFRGTVIHSIDYKNEKDFEGKRVLVVGCGNSGMEIALELVKNDAGPRPSIVVRSPNHVLPREIFGRSTVSLAFQLHKLLPLRMVDNLLLMYCNLVLGNTASYGLPRPVEGPLEFKFKTGKTPVIDHGTVDKIRQRKIKVVPNFIRIMATGVVFEDGVEEDFDALIFATGYKSEVRRWLKNGRELFPEDGRPGNRPPSDWKGSDGLYVAGFGKRGLLGASEDGQRIAQDISQSLKNAS
eukprot:PITA_20968